VILVYFFTFLRRKLCLKVTKLNQTKVLMKNEVLDTYGAPVFAPDYSTTVLAIKMCTNSNEHSTYSR
jgi:hypothetical protein